MALVREVLETHPTVVRLKHVGYISYNIKHDGR